MVRCCGSWLRGIPPVAHTDLSPGLRSVLQLLVTANIVPSSPILVTPMTKVISFSKMSVLTRTKRRHIQKYGIFHSHRRENINSCNSCQICKICEGRRGMLVHTAVPMFPKQLSEVRIYRAGLLPASWVGLSPLAWNRHESLKCRLTFKG
jgi:hypothetical protein